MTEKQIEYQDYLNTDHWRLVAESVKQRAGFRCQVCNSPRRLEAHHRTYEHKGRELEFLGDLVCLCRKCHGLFHASKKTVGSKSSRPNAHRGKHLKFFRRAAQKLTIDRTVLVEFGRAKVKKMLEERTILRAQKRKEKKAARIARRDNARGAILDYWPPA